eukprot:403351805
MAQNLTAVQLKAQKLLNDLYRIQVDKFSSLDFSKFVVLKQGKEDIDEAKFKNYILQTPIEELNVEKTAFDNHIINNVLKEPLVIEIKEFRNVSQPFQRAQDVEDEEKKTGGKKKDQTYQLKAHDGKRIIKIILLFDNQSSFVRSINEVNKFCLYDSFLTPLESDTFVVDYLEQIVLLYNDKHSSKLAELYNAIKGLPIKYTNAPRFVFLNEEGGDEGEKKEEEQEDEFADLYTKFKVPDLVGHERTYIKRFEQMGFWRKKFQNQVPQ